MPAARASSTAYWISGLSTTGSISFGIALVAGRNRVPSPPTGNIALRSGFLMTHLFLRSAPSQQERQRLTPVADLGLWIKGTAARNQRDSEVFGTMIAMRHSNAHAKASQCRRARRLSVRHRAAHFAATSLRNRTVTSLEHAIGGDDVLWRTAIADPDQTGITSRL